MTTEDFPAAVMLTAEFAEESLAEYGVYLEQEKLQQTFDAVLGTSFVAVVDGQVVGMLLGQIITDICSSRPTYQEIVWFVTKKYRKYGLRLLEHTEQWCRKKNINRIMMSLMHNSKTDKLFSLYEKLGFRAQETKFVKELE